MDPQMVVISPTRGYISNNGPVALNAANVEIDTANEANPSTTGSKGNKKLIQFDPWSVFVQFKQPVFLNLQNIFVVYVQIL